jgi:hypothetical protein
MNVIVVAFRWVQKLLNGYYPSVWVIPMDNCENCGRRLVVVTDSCGFEIFRVHSLFRPDHEPEGCPSCGTTEDGSSIACAECGFIPEEARA